MLLVLPNRTETTTQMCYPKQDNQTYLEFRQGTTKHRSRDPMTAGDLYNYRYVNFLSMSHLSLLLDGSLATVQRKDGTNKTDVPCSYYFPDYIKYIRTLTEGSTGGTGQCYSEEVELRPGGDFSPSRMLYPRLLYFRSFHARHNGKGRKKHDMKESTRWN